MFCHILETCLHSFREGWVGLLPNATTCAHEASEARCQLEVQLLLGPCASEQQGPMSARKPEHIDRRWLEVAGDGLAQAIEVCRKPRRVDMMVVAPNECDVHLQFGHSKYLSLVLPVTMIRTSACSAWECRAFQMVATTGYFFPLIWFVSM